MYLQDNNKDGLSVFMENLLFSYVAKKTLLKLHNKLCTSRLWLHFLPGKTFIYVYLIFVYSINNLNVMYIVFPTNLCLFSVTIFSFTKNWKGHTTVSLFYGMWLRYRIVQVIVVVFNVRSWNSNQYWTDNDPEASLGVHVLQKLRIELK